jgi:hypothetical protein
VPWGSRANAIEIREDGSKLGAVDPRSDGAAVAE